MSKAKTSISVNHVESKSKKQGIREKLEKALSDLQPVMGKKRFKRRIRKAGKLITNGLSKKDLSSYQLEPAFNNTLVMDDSKISDLP